MPDEPRFLSSNDISPFDIAEYKEEISKLTAERAWYYEWNGRDNKWAKLNENDPNPPTTLKPGKFDGQIVEVQRTK